MSDKIQPDEPLAIRSESEGATVDLPEGMGFFTVGQVLGERYEILELLGRGGMGEVWRAFDLKLRVEVALKALREDLFKSERRLGLLRQEVRAAREVVSPNVCRIFDLHEFNGRELVSMEYVDGATLLGVLQERGPLELKEAQDIASQFLAGLEAIHTAGLIHRDVKPENIMLTRAGRVVVMDFGLARGPESGAGSVSGTPAYMAPEHAAGQEVDARADVYSAGIVLAEMVSPDGIKSYQSRQSLWEGVRSEPAKVPDSPWAPVIKRAVARDRERRQNSAHTLIRELEDVTLRVEGAEDLHPYPGLAAFTEADAEFFFGREAEVERMWRKLEGPPRLLGIVGPSGAGKTSFIRAGLTPNAPSDWSAIRCTPGSAAIPSLRGALTSVLAPRSETLEHLLTDPDNPDVIVDALASSREGHRGALLIVDQFEELFTLNPPDQQERFTTLLARLPLETDIHVVLSMRDDFAAICSSFEVLQPVFHDLTMLNPPTGGNLRRALVQPATTCGYRFEDDELVEEILAEVEGERGALPLLAFALARLWDKRDRENGLLTRQAYHDIGGVGGALARHAEATVDSIGVERIPIVRELFRNLVTAEGTRAVREWDELLSIFNGGGGEGIKPSPTKTPHRTVGEGLIPSRDAASEVLSEMIDARLLTSYEVRIDEHEPTRRVEIIHESLLANWPRLVRWQTQDADAAQLRDQLRQAAKTWDEQGRTDDTLWTGSAYREYAVWREGYPGGLTAAEEAFADAMTSRNIRQRTRKRAGFAAVFLVCLGIAALISSALTLAQQKRLEALRAEAARLIALGQLRLEDYPTAALAHATASLELTDNEEARMLALEALWQAPPAFLVNSDPTYSAVFSPEGTWLVQSLEYSNAVTVISGDGSQRNLPYPSSSGRGRVAIGFGAAEDEFITGDRVSDNRLVALWSAPRGRMLASVRPLATEIRGAATTAGRAATRALFILGEGDLVTIESLSSDGTYARLGEYRMTAPFPPGDGICIPDTGDWFATVSNNRVNVMDLGPEGLSEPRLLGRHEGDLVPGCIADPLGRYLVTGTTAGEMRLWDPTGQRPPSTTQPLPRSFRISASRDGSLLYGGDRPPGEKTFDVWIWRVEGLELELLRRLSNVSAPTFIADCDPQGPHFAIREMPGVSMWPLGAPSGAEPISLRFGRQYWVGPPSFSPDGQWVATSTAGGLHLWSLARQYPAVLPFDFDFQVGKMDFAPDGSFLATTGDNIVMVIPLDGLVQATSRTVFDLRERIWTWGVAVSPDGSSIAVGSLFGSLAWIGRVDEEEARALQLPDDGGAYYTTFSPDGRLVAMLTGTADIDTAVFRVWDVRTASEVAVLKLDDAVFWGGSGFTDDGRLLTATSKGIVAWEVLSGEHRMEVESDLPFAQFVASDDGRKMLFTNIVGGEDPMGDPVGSPIFVDLDAGTRTTLTTHGLQVLAVALDSTGTIAVTGDRTGIVRVGPVTGEEPHLLMGHTEAVRDVAIDPRGRWIASSSPDNIVRLWPMPDLSKPPLHRLPRQELIAKLKTLTNIRLVRDPKSATGWTLTHDPFPGWETVPTW